MLQLYVYVRVRACARVDREYVAYRISYSWLAENYSREIYTYMYVILDLPDEWTASPAEFPVITCRMSCFSGEIQAYIISDLRV